MSTSNATDRSGNRFRVRSADGVELTVWVDGDGPPMVLVHGSFGDHTAWQVPIGVLREHFTTFAMDRRGFGASGDAPGYSIERDFADVASVVEAVADRRGRPATLWGHSYGANCAMGGANLTRRVHRLVLYEPSLGLTYPAGVIAAAEAALAAGDRETAVVRILADALELSDDELEALRASPRWPVLLAGAHTAPRECRAEEAWVYSPGRFDAIDAPSLLLSGSESPAPIHAATQRAAAAIPDARIHSLEGHAHFAHRTDPELVVSIVRDFVASSVGSGRLSRDRTPPRRS